MTSQYILRTILAAIALTIALIPTGCNSGLTSTAGVDHLLLQLQSNRSLAKVGEPIQIRFTITNSGQNHIAIESPDTPVMNIVVDVVGGPELLAWSTQNPDKVSHRLEWAPGESKIIEFTWVPRQEDVQLGGYRDIFLTGTLSQNSKIIQSAGVTVCASNFCR